jgi:hypothetical protein
MKIITETRRVLSIRYLRFHYIVFYATYANHNNTYVILLNSWLHVCNFSLFLHVYFSYTPVMFWNQTDPTGKFMNLVIAHCVIAQVRYMVSRHMVFEVVAYLLCRIYILVLFGSSWTYYNCQFRTWMFLGFRHRHLFLVIFFYLDTIYTTRYVTVHL